MSTPNDNKPITPGLGMAEHAWPTKRQLELIQLGNKLIVVEKQRDELRAILERFYTQTYGKTDLIPALDFEHARAAIAKVSQPSPVAVEQALAQEKANQEKIGATVQAARASATQPQQGPTSCRGCNHYIEKYNEAMEQCQALQAQRDELLVACKYAVQFSDYDINPTIRKRLKAAIARATEGGTGQ